MNRWKIIEYYNSIKQQVFSLGHVHDDGIYWVLDDQKMPVCSECMKPAPEEMLTQIWLLTPPRNEHNPKVRIESYQWNPLKNRWDMTSWARYEKMFGAYK